VFPCSQALEYDPEKGFSEEIVQKAGLYQDDEILLDHSGLGLRA
jgi:hypothetical protein